jgi:hypothetical protein
MRLRADGPADGVLNVQNMRIAFIAFLVAVWLLIDYPTGFWLFVYGGVLYWALLLMLRPSRRD